MSKPFRALEAYILDKYAGWLNRRIPPRREVTLVQNNIFIYPIGQFVYYFIVVAVLWIAATNYENNLAFALSFLMLSIFVTCIHHTYNNLAGLTITAIGAEPVFYGEYAEVDLLVSTREGKNRDALQLYWDREHAVHLALIDSWQARVKVPIKAVQRGWYTPGRLTIDSVYPLGIIRSVSYLAMDIQILVYPKPVCHGQLQPGQGDAEEGENSVWQPGVQEYSHLRDYEPGISLHRVAWKQYAKNAELLVKEYGDYTSNQTWLSWDAFPALGVEERLSTLCYWALQLDKKQEIYGLQLPGKEIQPGCGAGHLQEVLTCLALFEGEKKT